MQLGKTHKKVNNPQISARFLADYMAASEQARRTIVRNCKYPAIARVIQHEEAKLALTKFIREGNGNTQALTEKAAELRGRIADSEFDRDLYDHNADYIDRFVAVSGNLALPDAEVLPAGQSQPLTLCGVKITTDICVRLRRVTKTNKVRVGMASLRYAKGKALSPEVAAWQSAYIFGYISLIGLNEGEEPEQKLCLTLDAYSGIFHPAPTDSKQRFKNMEAACTSISERWENVEPPVEKAA